MGAERLLRLIDRDPHIEDRRKILPHEDLALLAADEDGDRPRELALGDEGLGGG